MYVSIRFFFFFFTFPGGFPVTLSGYIIASYIAAALQLPDEQVDVCLHLWLHSFLFSLL